MHSDDPAMTEAALDAALTVLEHEVAEGGWDQPPRLFAVVPTGDLLSRDPWLADRVDPTSLLWPVEQDDLPAGELDVMLAQVAWPDAVAGTALVQEVVMLPPDVAEDAPEGDASAWASAHPARREVRMVVGVLRGGPQACFLRVRGEYESDLLRGPGLAPGVAAALRATLED